MPGSTIQVKIAQLKRQQAKERRELTLYQSPSKTLYYFSITLWRGLRNSISWSVSHPVMLFFILPALALYAAAKLASHAPDAVNLVETWTRYTVWWLGLGVLSSIGMGTGMQSGVLFLFPHILKVCLAAETCGHTKFSILGDVWYSYEPFHCGDQPKDNPTFMDMYFKVIFTSMLWGAGTAIGEVPPYLMSYSAAIAGRENEDLLEEDVQVEPKALEGVQRLIHSAVKSWEQWMIGFIKQRGFWGIFMLASWPNAAFDLCGIACGAFMMPFWTFFIGTLLGKGVVKVNMQSLVLVTLFRKSSRDRLLAMIELLLPNQLPGLTLQRTPAQELNALISRSISKFQAKMMSKSAEYLSRKGLLERLHDRLSSSEALGAWAKELVPDTIAEAWTLIMVALIAMFAVSTVQALAQSCKAEEDKRVLAAAAEEQGEGEGMQGRQGRPSLDQAAPGRSLAVSRPSLDQAAPGTSLAVSSSE